ARLQGRHVPGVREDRPPDRDPADVQFNDGSRGRARGRRRQHCADNRSGAGKMTGMSMKPEVSIVIPVYNEQAGLANLFARLYPAMDKLGLPYEVIFINDGSRDNSVTILAEQYRKRPDV